MSSDQLAPPPRSYSLRPDSIAQPSTDDEPRPETTGSQDHDVTEIHEIVAAANALIDTRGDDDELAQIARKLVAKVELLVSAPALPLDALC